ncbi:MAG: Na/Pi cotransporter family protein [Firmicutes bacterium]|nr:Na/Pi cotransporter family protein [Bacillota bacterium]
MDTVKMIFDFLGGLGVFLFGMRVMGDGLQKVAGDRMRRVLEVLTTTAFRGVIVGALVTAIIQSSSATTVMLVGFVNAGLMTLKQAFGVIMGANIGTTMTAQLIAFKITKLALAFVGVGFLINLFGRRKLHKYFGLVLLGLGLLFMGLDFMSGAMKPLRGSQAFIDLMATFGKYPLLGVLIGAAMTSLIQSSSATIAMLMAVASQGLISFDAALPILFGDNIGTCITAALASIGVSKAAKRTALAHVLFNVFGAALFILLLPWFKSFVLAISGDADVTRLIANAHTSFNVMNTMIWLFMVNLMVKIVTRVIPGAEGEISGPVYLDKHLYNTPSVALGQATRELVNMASLASEMMEKAETAVANKDMKAVQRIYELENMVNHFQKEITIYLTELSQGSLTEEQSDRLTNLMHVVNDIERVGDHLENIAELAEFRVDSRIEFSQQAYQELAEIFTLVKGTFSETIKALETDDYNLARSVLERENETDEMERELRNNHIFRLNEGSCIPKAGIIYLDILSNLERVSDHAANIAQAVLDREGEVVLI